MSNTLYTYHSTLMVLSRYYSSLYRLRQDILVSIVTIFNYSTIEAFQHNVLAAATLMVVVILGVVRVGEEDDEAIEAEICGRGFS